MALFLGVLFLSLPEVAGITGFTPPLPSTIMSRDGVPLLEIGAEKRSLTPISDIPQNIMDAFLVAEDGNFYLHHGIDYLGILRAAWANLKAGRVVQGGSTITQQVAKQLYLSGERSIIRKIKDMMLAIKMEKKFTKNEILYLYLNQVYLGGGYYGVTAAFKGYFNKELYEATTAEAALIAGLLVAPARYSPYINPAYAKIRQYYVLKRLLETNKITPEKYEQSKKEVIVFRIKKPSKIKAGHFTSWIRQQLEKKIGRENMGKDGFHITTTLNWSLQEKAEKYISRGLRNIDKRQGYKGPMRQLQSNEAIKNFISEQRKKFYKENSQHFLYNSKSDDLVKYELLFTEEELVKIEEYDQINLDLKGRYKIYPGNQKDFQDSLRKLIHTNDIYDGIVLHVDSIHRIIYVSIGGVKGIIPYEGFRWARKRVITKDRNYIPLVTNPRSILKRGDVIQIKVIAQETSIYDMMNPEAKKKLTDETIIEKYKNESFLKLFLEQESSVEGSLIAIHTHTGEILSLVGGNNFKTSQFNRVIQSLRQSGSSFKPLLYAAALENGYKTNDIINDSPESLEGSEQDLNWKPRNYDGTFKGPITLRYALETSRNVPTIKLALNIGVDKIISFLDRIGLQGDFKPDLSLALGSTGINLINLTTAYAIFPNGGLKVTPKSLLAITDRFGNTYQLEDFEHYQEPTPKETILPKHEVSADEEAEQENIANKDKDEEDINPFIKDLNHKYVYDKRLAFIMTNLLQGVIQNGTGRGAKNISTFIGGKTGTTNNYVDALFIGFSSNVTLGVWIGFDDNKTLGWGRNRRESRPPYMERLYG